MNDTVQSILDDLVALDPSLRKSEKDLIPLLEKLVDSKPRLDLDDHFAADLRTQLMAHADGLMETSKQSQKSWFARFLAPLMGGAVAFAALMIGLMAWNGQIGVGSRHEATPATAPMAAQNRMAPTVEEPIANTPPAPMAKQAPAKPQAQDNGATKMPEGPRITTEAPAPAALQALPAEGEAEATPQPPSAPKRMLRETNTASAGISNVGNGSTTILQDALRRAQSGERKINSDSKQIGFRSPQELMALNFDNLPSGFEEIQSTLPAGVRAYVDWASGKPEYYLYFEKSYQWYGPF
jgi:hypothetical protein